MRNMDHNIVCRKEGVVLCLSGFEMDQRLHIQAWSRCLATQIVIAPGCCGSVSDNRFTGLHHDHICWVEREKEMEDRERQEIECIVGS